MRHSRVWHVNESSAVVLATTATDLSSGKIESCQNILVDHL